MDTTRILTWLGLPPGPWPPDDRTLLGLPPDGPVDPALAEQNALERSELIRPHQLVHPELVTEGMNRLAQALIAVTTPPPEPILSTPSEVAAVAPPPQPVLEAEVVSVVETPPPKAVPVAPTLVVPPDDPDPLLLAEVPPPAGSGAFGNRRKAYRELAFLRKLRRVWDRLGPLAGVPSEPVRTPEAVYIARTAGQELRQLLSSFPGAATIVERDGAIVSGVFAQPQPAVVLRDLLPDQRVALAADWAAGRRMIETGYTALRRSLRNSVPRRRLDRVRTTVRGFVRDNPEWVLAVLTIVLLAVGLTRVLSRPPPTG